MLRGLAVALVVVFHFWPEVLPGGFLGVSLFFTLSGYLITGLLVDEHARTGTVDLRRFWGRRFRRLMPAALAVLGIVAVAALWLPSPTDMGVQIVAAVGYVYNWFLIATGGDYGALFAQPSPVEHFWSLAIEEQFYVVFPVVALVALRGGRRVFTIVIAVALAASLALGLSQAVDPATAYLSTLTRAAEILIGALVALVLPLSRVAELARSRFRTLLGLVAILAVGVIIGASRLVDYSTVTGVPLFLPVTAVVSCVAIVASGATLGSVRGAWAVGSWLGVRSYGIYLIHWPLEVWLDTPALVKLVLTLVLAELSFRIVETPVRLRRALAAPRRALVVGVVAAFGVIVMGIVPTEVGRARETAAAEVPAAVPLDSSTTVASPSTSAVGPVPVPAPAAVAAPDGLASPPAPRDPSQPVTVWLIGDSQIDVLIDWLSGRRNPAQDFYRDDSAKTVAYAHRNGDHRYQLVDLAVPACEGGAGVAKVWMGYGEGRPVDQGEECRDWQGRWTQALAMSGPPDVVIWAVGGSATWVRRSLDADPARPLTPVDPEWQAWWRGSESERLRWLTAHVPAGTPVLWATPALPNRDEYPRRTGPDDATWQRIVASTAVVADLQREIASGVPGVRVLDYGSWVGSAGPDGGPLAGTLDGLHWDRATGLGEVWPWLRGQVDEAVGLAPRTW